MIKKKLQPPNHRFEDLGIGQPVNPGTLRTPMHLGVDWAGLLRVTPTNPQSRPDKCSSTDLGMSQPDNHKTESLPGFFLVEHQRERKRE